MSAYQDRQDELNTAYAAALLRARAHIAAGTDYTREEWQDECERARQAGLPGNANWSHRTPSPLSLDQVRRNDAINAAMHRLAAEIKQASYDQWFNNTRWRPE
jgi:hypothetical protein